MNPSRPDRIAAIPWRVRRGNLYRALLALTLMLLLSVGLLVSDGEEEIVREGSQAPVAAMQPALPESSAVPPSPTSEPEPALSGHTDLPAAPSPQAPAGSTHDIASASQSNKGQAEPAGTLEPAPEPAPETQPGPESPVAAAAIAQPKAGASAKQPPRAGGASTTRAGARASYRLQVGDFTELQRAESLHTLLTRRHYPVRMQMRVAVGPFTDRSSAELARVRLHSELGLRGLIVSTPASASVAIQVAVFSEPANARALAARLAALGHESRLEGRVVLGPYPDRETATAALKQLRSDSSIQDVVIMLPAT